MEKKEDYMGDIAVGPVKDMEDPNAPYDPFHDREVNKGLQRGLKPRHVSVGLRWDGADPSSSPSAASSALVFSSAPATRSSRAARSVCSSATPSTAVFLSGGDGRDASDASIMQGIGEMASYMPVAGGHMRHAELFVDPALGFAVNWAYAIVWMLVNPAE